MPITYTTIGRIVEDCDTLTVEVYGRSNPRSTPTSARLTAMAKWVITRLAESGRPVDHLVPFRVDTGVFWTFHFGKQFDD